jgi:membrane-associated phospholipid phosphatase
MDQLMQFEIQITLFLQHVGTWLVYPFTAITDLGNEYFYLLVMPALYWCVDATLGFRLGVMLVMTNSINGYFKVIFHSPRPFWVDSRVKALTSETSFGLPSGHSQNAASMWGMASYILKKKWLTIIGVLAVFLIGLSRIYLGVHFTRDVLAGWVIGFLLILLYFWIEKPISLWIGKKSLTFQIITAFLVSLAIIGIGLLINAVVGNYHLPTDWINNAISSGAGAPDPFNQEGTFTIAGIWFGFVAGYAWLFHKKGKIIVQGSTSLRVARFAVGLAGIGVIYLGLKVIFPASPEWLGFAFRFIRYALIGLWVSALAPMLFEKLHLES